MDNRLSPTGTDGAASLIVAAIAALLIALAISAILLFAAHFTFGEGGIIDSIRDVFTGQGADKIAVIYVEGPMVADKSPEDKKAVSSTDVVRSLRKATDNDAVRAIVLRVNSPGGTPVAAEEIISQIEKTRKEKPVVVSMGDMATSAAYYISSRTDRIVANPDTFTGSIGVIWVFKNRTRFYEDEGITFYVAKSGEYKDAGADWRGLSDSEKDYVQEIIDESYDRFVRGVATGRNLSEEEVREYADGRVFTGSRAKEIGLVDELGGLYDAVDLAADLAEIPDQFKIVYMNEPESTWQPD